MKRSQRGAKFGLKYWSERHPMPVETAQRYWPISDFIRDYDPPNWKYVLLRFRWGGRRAKYPGDVSPNDFVRKQTTEMGDDQVAGLTWIGAQ